MMWLIKKLSSYFAGKNNFSLKRDFRPALVPDPVDERDIVLKAYLKPRRIPKAVEWYFSELPIRDQGQTNTCVGQSCSSMKIAQEYFEHKAIFDFDGYSLYDECKKIDDYSGDGTFLRIALKVLANDGLSPNGISTLEKYKIGSYARLEGLEDMKYALASTGPIVIGIKVYENMENVKEDGFVPEAEGSMLGGHAILITGYDDTKGGFRMVNSWGKDWGIDGTAWLSYNFIEQNMMDAWSAIDVDDPVAKTFLNMAKLKKDVAKATE